MSNRKDRLIFKLELRTTMSDDNVKTVWLGGWVYIRDNQIR